MNRCQRGRYVRWAACGSLAVHAAALEELWRRPSVQCDESREYDGACMSAAVRCHEYRPTREWRWRLYAEERRQEGGGREAKGTMGVCEHVSRSEFQLILSC